MSMTNTILHRRIFEGLIEQADRKDGSGADVAFAILYAALAAARRRVEREPTLNAASRFLSIDDEPGT